ncbi:DNA-binding protein [Aeromicrobium phragmitis]|uniref:DNA-binding protein n=1 Tax=Aeromicrobium phragmitis TaxID=2478914 RepID=A0A3L8PMP1_9ACTN|nr:helix-turn-helix domain-containing protein [Aeromicrobium phragmitis]RLV56033.1 DNA-binding protein [Aeromicrobium phragmitis]
MSRLSPTSLEQRIWFNTEQAAAYSGYHVQTVRRALEAGELKGSQRTAGGRWRIHRDALDAWLSGEKASA